MKSKVFLSFISALIALSSFSLTLGVTSCSLPDHSTDLADSLFLYIGNSQVYYKLNEPDNEFLLPYSLAEVSGLSFLEPRSLMMIEDENGKVYEYDLHYREVINGIKFEKRGDFEGLEAVDDDIYVLRSDGNLYRMKYTTRTEVDAEKIETPLRAANNVEGLGYDPEKKMLLLACKEAASYTDQEIAGHAVYGYSISRQQFLERPLFVITDEQIEAFLEKAKGHKYGQGRIKFKPSGIAYHPIEKRYYILASTGKLILVVEKDGSLVASYPVYSSVLNQPEGICFGSNGDLFISSEGEGSRGYVLRFKMYERKKDD